MFYGIALGDIRPAHPRFQIEVEIDNPLDVSLQDDIVAVARIDAVASILQVVCRTTGMRFAAVARVTESRWIACGVRDEISFGLLPGGELEVESTICAEIRDSGRPVAIDDVHQSERFCNHHTPTRYGFRSYISVPIYRRDREFFGTLCALDPNPAKPESPETLGMFRLFADLIGFHLDAQDRLQQSERALVTERQDAELREQFIAVLGHDLRNPLASISSGAQLARKVTSDDRIRSILSRMDKSVLRMAGLIDNLLDFARGRLGGGFTLSRSTQAPLVPELEQVIAELQSAWPERRIISQIALHGPVDCDRARMAQLLSNLLANALIHGDPLAPIYVEVTDKSGTFELVVRNQGKPIPDATIDQLFKPFFRAATRPSANGLGLGLFIVAEIARAHGGTIDVVSTTSETRFSFSMPLEVSGPL